MQVRVSAVLVGEMFQKNKFPLDLLVEVEKKEDRVKMLKVRNKLTVLIALKIKTVQ